MIELVARYRPFRLAARAATRTFAPDPRPDDAGRAPAGEVTVRDELSGRVVAIQYLLDPHDVTDVRYQLRRLPAPTVTARESGMRYRNVVFGAVPPMVTRQRDGARLAELTRRAPEAAGALADFAGVAAARLHEPLAGSLASTCAALHQAWRLGGTGFTSGIVNYDAQLPYHRDRENVPGSGSAMLVLRDRCDGGYLHLPEWDVWLTCPDRALVVFDGQAIWHGNTALHPRHAQARRLSIVYYARAKMIGAGSPADELRRHQLTRTARERRAATP